LGDLYRDGRGPLTWWRVQIDPRVGNVRNDDPSLIEPVKLAAATASALGNEAVELDDRPDGNAR
jgi:hypothetical protein